MVAQQVRSIDELVALPDAAPVNESEAAALVGLSVRSLQGDRCTRGSRIAYFKVGKSVRYTARDCRRYLASCRIEAVADGGTSARP